MSQPSTTFSQSRLDLSFVAEGGRTRVDRVFERGALRLRQPNAAACEGIIVNTGGGIVGGDRLTTNVTLGPGACVTLTTVAAEKIYRAVGAEATIDTGVTLGAGAHLDWLPQETILFDSSALRRSFRIDIAGDSRFLAAEAIVFGRVASDEPSIRGLFRDSWRIRRENRLVFADETRLDGAIGETLDRPAVGQGARAVALVVLVAPDAESLVDRVRTAMAPYESDPEMDFGVSARDGILIARFLACAPQRLRDCLVIALCTLRPEPLPRVWL